MTAKNLSLLCLFVAGLMSAASAQQKINFTSLNTRDGLSSNTVNAILKDRYGVMWFATEDGLDKFDGTSFTVYRHRVNDSTSLGANEVLSLHEDKSGNLWVGTSGGSLNLYDRKRDVFINYPAETGANSFSNNVINSVCSDRTGGIWVAHFKGVEMLDPLTKKISTVALPANHLDRVRQHSAIVVYNDRQNYTWIGTMGGLYRWNPRTRSVTAFLHREGDASTVCNDDVHAICQDRYGNIWVGTQSGLSKYDAQTNSFTTFRHSSSNPSSISSDLINSIAADGDTLWLGTDEGLDLFNIRTGQASKFRYDDRDIHSLTAKAVRHIYIDRQGIYWLGMVTGGVNKYDKNLNLFNFVKSNVFDELGLRASMVTSFAPDKDGNVYVGTEGGGLSLFNRKTRLFRHFNIASARQNADQNLSILAMAYAQPGELLIGTFADGLFVLNTDNNSYRQLMQGRGADDLNSNDIFCITRDHKGQIWLGTNGAGINVMNSANQVVRRYTPSPTQSNDYLLPINGYIRAIEEDREGNIWIGSHGGGIAVLDAAGKFTIYNTANSALPNNKVLTLLHDSGGNIWAGTFGGGLAFFNKKSRRITVFAEKDGLQNNVVYKIVEDARGLIWVSTNKGISSINPVTRKISNYNYHNGIQHNNFVLGAGLRMNSGEIFFGGVEGFNYFNPADLRQNKNIPPVLITELRISNRTVLPSDDGPLREHISIAKKIDLDYKQNFALSFVGLNYTSPEQNEYAYKLEGFDEDWNYVGSTTTASYTNLDPGEYIFHVKASNNDNTWNEEGRSIRIIVHPPFWRTTLAYLFYFLAAAGLIWYLRKRSLDKLQAKFAQEQERLRRVQERREAEKLQELNGLKIKFLTNLSHEFRTPISLILGPVDTLIAGTANTENAGQLNMIRRNAKRLLNLVNQLLDFRKMEEQELKLHATDGELVAFVSELSGSFQDVAEKKNIRLHFHADMQQYHTRFDHDKLERILFNLLSNAFKFTLKGGSIDLHVKKAPGNNEAAKGILFSVQDTGIGISAGIKEKIFEQFFQDNTAASILNQGTGIGLAITKEFVNMHGGTIDVESEPGKGTCFHVFLPLKELPSPDCQQLPIPPYHADLQHTPPAVDEKTLNVNGWHENGERPCILLVEDNDDFRMYLKDHLNPQYKVVEATNGKEGWQHTLAHHPVLIVSDISMPVMDGIQLTQKIRCDKRTSHIPVILLTALRGETDQIKGLRTGANDYVTKPFNFEVLNAKIRNLLALNDKLKTTYSKQIQVVAPELIIESEDEKLMQTVMRYLEDNLTNPQLSVEELSRHVGMSRSSLYAKLLELTGKTPVEFIRGVKLDKAAVLLEKSNMNVAQIAYSVGFSTPNYFARSFKAKFDMLPSEYLNKMRRGKTTNANSH